MNLPVRLKEMDLVIFTFPTVTIDDRRNQVFPIYLLCPFIHSLCPSVKLAVCKTVMLSAIDIPPFMQIS